MSPTVMHAGFSPPFSWSDMPHIRNGGSIVRSVRLLLLGILATICAPLLCVARAHATVSAPDTVCIVYFGDSITEGWMDAVLHATHAYPSICDSLLAAGGMLVRSTRSARGGTTTEDALRSLSTDVLDRAPRIVVIAFGTNDWYIHGHATVPRVPPADFRRNLRFLVQAVRAGGAHAVLLGLPPIVAARFHQFSPASLYEPYGGADSLRARYDRVIAETALEQGIPYVAVPFTSDVLPMAQGDDGVHPTILGHTLIAHALAPVLAREALRAAETLQPRPMAVRLHPQPLRARAGAFLCVEVDLDAPEDLDIACVDARGRRLASVLHRRTHVGTNHVFLQPLAAEGTLPGAGAYFMHIRAGRRHRVVPLIIQ